MMYEHPRGKSGKCSICGVKKSTLVNGVCLECASPETKRKHVPKNTPQVNKENRS
jgi:hypothetical protein